MYTYKLKVYMQVHIATFSYLQVTTISYVYCKYTKQAMYTLTTFSISPNYILFRIVLMKKWNEKFKNLLQILWGWKLKLK